LEIHQKQKKTLKVHNLPHHITKGKVILAFSIVINLYWKSIICDGSVLGNSNSRI
jgi:hypothetical protein